MKTRLGFVSNSSSTSFCIVGICNDGGVEHETREKAEEAGLDTYVTPEGDSLYAGLDIDKMRDDETLIQFKERAKKALLDANLIDINDKVALHTDGWYDG